MGFFPCNTSVESLTRKIASNLANLTKSKSKFHKDLDSFVFHLKSYNDKKRTIVVDIIKIELTNTQNKSEVRYLYLSLLDKLILVNFKFLKIVFESNLLTYIVRLSEFANHSEFFNSFDDEESKQLLSTLATSSLKNWYDKYNELNESCVLLLKQYIYDITDGNQINGLGSEIEELSCLVKRESDDYKTSVKCNEIGPNKIEEYDKINDESNNSYNSNIQSQLESNIDKNSIDKFEIRGSSTEKKDKFDIKTNSSVEYDTELGKSSKNVETLLECTNFLEKNEENNKLKLNQCAKENNMINQIKEFNEKYSKLKEKYLILVQKNDYLQSRLDFYENYSFRLKNSYKKKNMDEVNPIFKDVLEIIHSIENDGFISNFRRLISENDWVLFEDNTIQIGLKCYFESAKGNIYIYFGNKLPTRLEDFNLEFNLKDINQEVLEIKREKPLPYYISGKQQICAKFTVNCNDIFFGIPTLAIRFLLSDSSKRNIELPFPLVLSKFFDKIECDSETILKLWHSDVFLMSQSSFQFDSKTTNIENISELIEKCKLGNTFKLQLDDPEKNEKPSKRIYLFGSILDHQIIIQLQLHGISDKYTLSIRSDSGILSSSILSIIKLQINETIL
ncbi:adaptin AP complex subunit alpha [Cryptosporidium ryanae]|uniref:adaptin AP complex subunit alpha n=1 Tax=Cryptosporidium ryanae TaxID=515981 RepID=UPI00351A3204|nr:adaptin AP complex subunit alpha [Cryptosporidium ryanae]